jgi:transposase
MLGIDVSKADLTCTLLDAATHRPCWQRSFPNTPAGIEQLVAKTPPSSPWVLEPTGRYSLCVAQQACAAGRRVLLAPTKKARAYLNSLSERAKTDRLDSEGLALFALTRPASQPLSPYPIRSDRVEQLQQLLTARKGIARALCALGQQARELPYAKEPLEQAIQELKAQRASLDRQIQRLTSDRAAFPETQRLQAIPGIGPVIAASVTARLKGRTFRRADQFVAYSGLDIGVICSGKRKGERGLTKQGDAELRRLFYLAAKANLRSRHSPFRAHFERERAKGRSKTAALCIVARKLAQVCWSIVEHGTLYDPERVYRQPGSPPPQELSP